MAEFTVVINGIDNEIYQHISTVEDLVNIQKIITTKFFEKCGNESVEHYFENTPHLEIYDRICDYPELMDDIVDKAVEEETNYQTLEEVSQALSNMQDALDCIYNTSRDFT